MIGPLTGATLKSFLRSRRTLLILFVLPLLLISSIFISFNPDGLRPVPAGIVLNSGLEMSQAVELFDMLTLARFSNTSACIDRVKRHDVYLCMNVYGNEQVTVELYYDNTQEPVIWEVINLLEYKLQLVQRERTAEAADSLFSSLNSLEDYLDAVAQTSRDGEDQLTEYEQDVIVLRNDLSSSRQELTGSLDEMDRDVAASRAELNDARRERDDSLAEVRARLDEIEWYADTYLSSNPNASSFHALIEEEIDTIRSDLDVFEDESNARFASMEASLDSSEQRIADGRITANRMRSNEARMASVARDLRAGQAEFADLRSTTLEFDTVIDGVIETGSEPIVDSVRMINQPIYVPSQVYSDGSDAGVQEGFNLLSYQTLFPSLLMLVVLFFGILLSTFMTITYVTTPAYVRLRIVQGSWITDFVAMLISSVLIGSVSVALFFGLGVFLFQIPLTGVGAYAFLLFGILTVLTLIGILIVHLIWSESMSIIVSMFALVSLLFSSGFVLPIERMSPWAAKIASINPITIGLEAFDRLIFYAAPPAATDWIAIGAWFFMLVFAILVIRLLREQ